MLLQQIINGFVAGSAYALFALGFTLMFGVLGVVNLTYGFYFSAGAYIALFATLKGAPLVLALPAAAIGAGPIAVVLDSLLADAPAQGQRARTRLADGHARRDPFSLFGHDGAVSSDIRRFPLGLIDNTPYNLGGATISPTQI